MNMLKSIPYGKWYFVTEDGRVLSNKSGKMKELKYLTKGHQGYLKVRLYNGKGSEWKDFFVHRLVAEAFIPNPNNLPVINHKDENPANNHVSNLEWCTVQYNNTYGTARKKVIEGIRKHYEDHPEERERVSRQLKERWRTNPLSEESRRKIAEKLYKPVCALSDGVIVAEYKSIKEAEQKTGAKRSNIVKVIKGERKKAGGYEWKYAACGCELQTGGE